MPRGLAARWTCSVRRVLERLKPGRRASAIFVVDIGQRTSRRVALIVGSETHDEGSLPRDNHFAIGEAATTDALALDESPVAAPEISDQEAARGASDLEMQTRQTGVVRHRHVGVGRPTDDDAFAITDDDLRRSHVADDSGDLDEHAVWLFRMEGGRIDEGLVRRYHRAMRIHADGGRLPARRASRRRRSILRRR